MVLHQIRKGKMLKTRVDINIWTTVRHNPFNIFLVGFRALRGAIRRKAGVYSNLKTDSYIRALNNSRVKLRFSQKIEDKDFWQSQFCISLNEDFKWNTERDLFLEHNFYKIIKSNQLPAIANDREHYWSAFQLNWLFFNVRTGSTSAADAKLLLESCCRLLMANRDHWVFRTFTISEILTNIVKIKIYFGNTLDISGKIEEFLSYSICFISENLEVYAISEKTSLNYTNNHILANARALFWATKIFDNVTLQQTAEYVYENWCKTLFNNGNLDEGSTTYHMVAAQCIFDISFFIKTEDLPRVDLLIFQLEKNGFLEPDTFPVIGDISPDPSLACVITDALAISELIRGWHKKTNSPPSKSKNSNSLTSDFEFFKADNWSWVIHSRSPEKHIQHSHNDYGSPVLMYKNQTIICDLGRASYANGIKSKQLALTNCHSVPQINFLDQNPRSMRDLFPSRYISPKVSKVTDFQSALSLLDSGTYEVICGKEYRLFPNELYGGCWSRLFAINRFNKDEIVILDTVELDVSESVTFRKFSPERIGNDTTASLEFKLNQGVTLPTINKALRSKFYGHTANADVYSIFSEPSENHCLITYVRIINE